MGYLSGNQHEGLHRLSGCRKEEEFFCREIQQERGAGGKYFRCQIIDSKGLDEKPQHQFVEQKGEQGKSRKKGEFKMGFLYLAMLKNPLDAQQVADKQAGGESEKVRNEIVDLQKMSQEKKDREVR